MNPTSAEIEEKKLKIDDDIRMETFLRVCEVVKTLSKSDRKCVIKAVQIVFGDLR